MCSIRSLLASHANQDLTKCMFTINVLGSFRCPKGNNYGCAVQENNDDTFINLLVCVAVL